MAAKGRGGGITPPRIVELLQEQVSRFGQSEVARKTGLTRQTVQRYMQGIGEPSNATLQKLSDTLDVNIAWLQGVRWAGKHDSIDLNYADIQNSWGELLDRDEEAIRPGLVKYIMQALEIATSEELSKLSNIAEEIFDNHSDNKLS